MERKRIEAKVRTLQFAKAEENIMPFSDMKEQVLKACEQRLNGHAHLNQREKSKSRLRLIRGAVLAAACLFIAVSVYAVLDPVPVSNANSFLRRAQIWVGDVLKVDVAVVPPEEKGVIPDAAPGDGEGITALKEFQEAYGLTILIPTQLPAEMTLGEIKTSGPDDYLAKIQYSYQDQNDTLDIIIKEVADASGMGIFVKTIEHQTPVGTFIIWASANGWDAVTISGSSDVYIRGTMDKDAFITILDGLRAID